MHLASEDDAATALISDAVSEFRRNMGTSTEQQYEQLGRLANDARGKSEQARLALERPTADHWLLTKNFLHVLSVYEDSNVQSA
jgi:hypothetical protein